MAPTAGITATGRAFTSQLKVSGAHGATRFAQSTGTPRVTVSAEGKVSAPASLAAGTYRATGTVRDVSGDSGTWSFDLTVTAGKITQLAPTAATTKFGEDLHRPARGFWRPWIAHLHPDDGCGSSQGLALGHPLGC